MKSEMEIDPVDGVTFSNPSGDVTKALTKVMAQAKAQESEGGALKTTMSKKSLKDKAVNPQVEVCKKTLKSSIRAGTWQLCPQDFGEHITVKTRI